MPFLSSLPLRPIPAFGVTSGGLSPRHRADVLSRTANQKWKFAAYVNVRNNLSRFLLKDRQAQSLIWIDDID